MSSTVQAVTPVSLSTVSKGTSKKLSAQAVGNIFGLTQSKITLNASPGQQDKVTEECIKVLAQTGLVFDRGGLTAIDQDGSVHLFCSSTLRLALSRLVDFTKAGFVKGYATVDAIDCPAYVGDIVKLSKWEGIPKIDSITDHPVITPSGRVVGAGFDSEVRVFGQFEMADFDIPANPTLDDAASAYVEFSELLQTFEFENGGDRVATLAAFLTAVSRPVLPTAPIILIDAPVAGSGKGYLGGLIARTASNQKPNSKQLPANPDEVHKAIVSSLISAQPVMFFDELALSELDCPAIRTLATAEIYSARLLGQMREVNLSTKSLVLCTGNNISPTADTSRRILHIRLNPLCENPSARQFSFDASAEMAKHRNKFVSLLLTIQKAFLIAHFAGETKKPDTAIGSFGEWDLMCRQPIMWLTGDDPCARMSESMRSNPAKGDLLTVLTAWKEEFGSEAVQASTALKNSSFYEVADEAVNRRPGSVLTAKTLGIWIRKHKDQVVQNMAFLDGGLKGGCQHWLVRHSG